MSLRCSSASLGPGWASLLLLFTRTWRRAGDPANSLIGHVCADLTSPGRVAQQPCWPVSVLAVKHLLLLQNLSICTLRFAFPGCRVHKQTQETESDCWEGVGGGCGGGGTHMKNGDNSLHLPKRGRNQRDNLSTPQSAWYSLNPSAGGQVQHANEPLVCWKLSSFTKTHSNIFLYGFACLYDWRAGKRYVAERNFGSQKSDKVEVSCTVKLLPAARSKHTVRGNYKPPNLPSLSLSR